MQQPAHLHPVLLEYPVWHRSTIETIGCSSGDGSNCTRFDAFSGYFSNCLRLLVNYVTQVLLSPKKLIAAFFCSAVKCARFVDMSVLNAIDALELDTIHITTKNIRINLRFLVHRQLSQILRNQLCVNNEYESSKMNVKLNSVFGLFWL